MRGQTNRPPMEPTSQVLLRNRHFLHAEHPLVVNFPADGFLGQLQDLLPDATITAYTYDYSAYRTAQALLATSFAQPPQLVFGPVYPPDAQPQAAPAHDLAILYLPKGRTLTQMVLAMIANVLQPDAHLLLVGSGNAGIRSSRTLLEEQIGPAVQRDAARHCVLFQAALRKTPSPFNLDEWVQTFHFPFHAHTMTTVSLPGVFSHGELDPGSALLLQTLDTPPTGRTLDFGCGAGILGAAIRKVWPHTIVDMVDVNALALEATRRTLLANGLPAQNIHPSDVFSGVTGRYALILSNPPFHTGVEIDYRATTALFEEARNHLEPGGKVRIVANRFLKYAPILESTLGSYKIIAEDNRYRVYEVA